MSRAIAHRGPDAEGFFREPGVQLAHRRLAIVDLSAAGRQPMTNEDGRLQIVYNGEIFNHAQIRPLLEQRGHRYRSQSDTETILHAYEEYGPGCLEYFRGMFAFAVWDRQARKLFCARDRLGKKPFYYYWDGQVFVFASEIKALLEHPAVRPRLNENALAEYVAFGFLNTEETLFANVRKLAPGHWLRLTLREDAGQLETQRYWNLPGPGAAPERTEAEWISQTRERLEETVRMRLMSDVPLGVFLSGGVDSSAIAALVKQFTSGAVQTFSVGYPEGPYSELSYAREVAETIGTEHHEVTVPMGRFFEALPRVLWHEDEPVTWPSSVSLHLLAELARRQVAVVLTGEGSDEMFGGYGRYQHYLRDSRLMGAWGAMPAGLQRLTRQAIARAPIGREIRRKLQHTVLGREARFESIYLDNYYGAFTPDECATLFARVPGIEKRYQPFLECWNQGRGQSLLGQMLQTDQRTYLIELLMKQDQMSMSHSLESRVPFLDHEFVEFAASIPDSLKIRAGEGKYILKKAVAGLIPDRIIYRKKMGFPTPLKEWLIDPRAGRIFDLLQQPGGLLESYVDRKALQHLIGQHRSRREDATDRIWRLLNLQLWGEVFLAGRKEQYLEGWMREEAATR